MEEQTVKCRICGKTYNVEGDCATDQAVCPPCRYREKSPKDEREPLDYSGLQGKFNIKGQSK